MYKRKLVHLSDGSDDEEEDSPCKGSFISGMLMTNLHEKLINSTKYVQSRIEQVNNLEPDEPTEQFKGKQNKVPSTKPNKFNNDKIECVTLDDDSQEAADPKANQTVASTSTNSKSTNTVKNQDEIIVLDDDDDDGNNVEDEDVVFISDKCDDIVSNKKESFVEDDLSYEEFVKNKPMKIKIKRLDKIEYFELLRWQPMSTLFDEISTRFDIPIPKMILYLNDVIVDAKSTPNQLELNFADIFELLSRRDSNHLEDSTNPSNSTKDDPNFVELHLRDNTKKRITLRINRFEMVRKLVELYASERGLLAEAIHLEFDSDPMSLDKKIDFYELENDDQIDVIIKN